MSTPKPPFNSLWNLYSSQPHGCSMALPNQCAIRMSRCLIAGGWSKDAFKSTQYPGKVCPHGYARGAQDLGAFLAKRWGNRTLGFSAPGSAPSAVSGRKGVVCFMNIPGFSGQGHIDLWDGSGTKTGDYWSSQTIWFWELT